MGDLILGGIATSLLSGLICAFFAKEKGYNIVLWFFGGVIFSVIAIGTVALIKKKKKNEAKNG